MRIESHEPSSHTEHTERGNPVSSTRQLERESVDPFLILEDLRGERLPGNRMVAILPGGGTLRDRGNTVPRTRRFLRRRGGSKKQYEYTRETGTQPPGAPSVSHAGHHARPLPTFSFILQTPTRQRLLKADIPRTGLEVAAGTEASSVGV